MPSKNRRTKLLTVWLDPRELSALTEIAAADDSDRSKLVRKAVRDLIIAKQAKRRAVA